MVLVLGCIAPACLAAWIVYSLFGPARPPGPVVLLPRLPRVAPEPAFAGPPTVIVDDDLMLMEEPPTVSAPPPALPVAPPVLHRPRFAPSAPEMSPPRRAPRGTPSPQRARAPEAYRTFQFEERTRLDP